MEIELNNEDKEKLFEYILKNAYKNWDKEKILREIAKQIAEGYLNKISEKDLLNMIQIEVRKVLRMGVVKEMLANDYKYTQLMKFMERWDIDIKDVVKDLKEKHPFFRITPFQDNKDLDDKNGKN